MPRKKSSAAADLGRRGGRKRVPKGFAKMDPARLAEIAGAGAKASAIARRKAAAKKSKRAGDNKAR